MTTTTKLDEPDTLRGSTSTFCPSVAAVTNNTEYIFLFEEQQATLNEVSTYVPSTTRHSLKTGNSNEIKKVFGEFLYNGNRNLFSYHVEQTRKISTTDMKGLLLKWKETDSWFQASPRVGRREEARTLYIAEKEVGDGLVVSLINARPVPVTTTTCTNLTAAIHPDGQK
ncbi:hypothetical protein CBL_04315 [Carabus blaptoides fortunei]